MKTKKVSFKNSKGQKLFGIFFLPDKGNKFPTVIICHGLYSVKESANSRVMAPIITKKGIAAFAFDFHGHGESEGRSEDILPSQSIDDLVCAIDFVLKQDFIDPNRVGLFGSSFSGIATVTVASEDERIKYLALRAPVSDFKKQYSNKKRYNIAEWKRKGYIEHINSIGTHFRLDYNYYLDGLKIDELGAAKKIKIPTLVVCGDKDTTVLVEAVQKLYDQFSGEKEIVWVKGVDHTFGNKKKEALTKLANWLIGHLK